MSDNPKLNSEGYYDPTAYEGMKSVIQADNALMRDVNNLIHVLKYIIDNSGFELVSRIEIRHKKTGRIFR